MENQARLAKCPRCGKIFSKDKALVCLNCTPEEDADYEKISQTIGEHPGVGVDEVARIACVGVAVVLRMLQSGRIETQQEADPYRCGRCGKPAISKTKRLCEACLVKLDQEWAETVREMRKNITHKSDASAHAVHEAVTEKRAGGGASSAQPIAGKGKISPPSALGSRELLQDRRQKIQRKP